MRIVLFDADASGHREPYIRRMVAVLHDLMDVTVAVPDELAERLADIPADCLATGPARAPGTFRPLDRRLPRRIEAELSQFDRAIAAARADHAFHLSGDSLLRWLLRRPVGSVQLSLLIFRPRVHYPAKLGSPLTRREAAVGRVFELMLRRWRRRSDAQAVFTLDPIAASRWSRQSGAPAIWFPEPPVLSTAPVVGGADRDGCALVGSLTSRKGIHLLAAASSLPVGSRVLLAGPVASGYGRELASHASALEARGVRVELRDRNHSEAEILHALAHARCAVLPYPRNFGMSRVLLEASVARTPVVVHDFGLLGHLVRTCGLGRAVDCTDAEALSVALRAYLEDPNASDHHRAQLERFAERFSAAAFASALRRPFEAWDGRPRSGQANGGRQRRLAAGMEET